MHKKAIALLAAALALTSCLAACAKHSKYGKVFVDSRGMEHVLVTDANGVTVLDAKGNLVEVMTGSDGKPIPAITENGTVAEQQEGDYQTSPVTFPGVLVNDDSVEDQYCTVGLPKGWTATNADKSILITHGSTGARVTIQPNAARTAATAIESIQEECEAMGIDYEMDEADLDGFTAKVMRYSYAAMGLRFTTYAVNNNTEFATTVICTVDEDKADAVSFDEVLQNIHFK